MMRAFITSTFFFVFWCQYDVVISQKRLWDETKLEWSDFKKRIQNANPHHAFTYSGISFEISANNDTVDIKVQAYFDPTQSWVDPEHCADQLLAHEQLHFDITELYTRKMRKEFQQYQQQPVKQFIDQKLEEKVKDLFKKLYNEHLDIQQQYDAETQHGIVGDAQLGWFTRIKSDLNQYNSFYQTGN